MGWLRVSRRIRLIAALTVAASLVIGLIATAVDGEAAWSVAGGLLSLAIVVVVLGKSAHNAIAEGVLRIEAAARSEAPSEPSPGVVYEPGEPLDMLRRDLQRDISSMLDLHARQDVPGAMPPPGGWAATPESLSLLVDIVRREQRIGTIVEFGSGTSTAWIALALQRRGEGRLVSFDHDAGYAATTAAQLADLGLADRVDLRVAKLVPRPDTASGLWFRDEAFDGLDDITLLFVDGPPAFLAPRMRFPALPQLAARLAPRALILLDDTDRLEEQQIVDRWMSGEGGVDLEVVRRTDRATLLRRR